MPRKKQEDTVKSIWVETSEAAEQLGISPDYLLRIRLTVFKSGKHYRVKNPKASTKGRRYLWHLARCEKVLSVE